MLKFQFFFKSVSNGQKISIVTVFFQMPQTLIKLLILQKTLISCEYKTGELFFIYSYARQTKSQ